MVGHAERDLRAYWLGQSVSVVGDQLAAFVLPSIAIVTFGASAVQVGVLNALGMGAYAVFGLLTGALLDRIRRRPAMIVGDAVRLLAFASVPVAAAAGRLGLAQLYVVAAVAGLMAVVFNIASQAHLPTLLPARLLGPANARLEISSGASLVAGPMLGGLLVQWVGGATALGFNAASFLASIASLLLLRTREPPLPEREPAPIRRSVAEGLWTLWSQPLLRRTTIASGLRNLGNGAVGTVMLLFAYRVLGLSSGVVGLLFGAGAVAAVLGGLLMTRYAGRLPPLPVLRAACLAGAVWVLAPLATVLASIPVLLVIRAVSAFSLPLWNATIATVRQRLVPAELLGRVSATAGTVNFCAIPLGAVLGGVAAERCAAALGPATGISAVLAAAGLVTGAGAVLLGSGAAPPDDVPAGEVVAASVSAGVERPPGKAEIEKGTIQPASG